MLGGDHDGVGAHRLAVLVSKRHLALGVRPELGHPPGVPRLGHLMQDTVGVEDRRRHQRLGLAAGIAEHNPLIARALVLVGVGIGIDAAGDVGRLFVHIILELAALPVEALLLVADLAHGAARCLFDDLRRHALGPTHLSRHDDAVGGDEGLDGDARMWVGGKVKIDHCVGYAVANFVGMTLRHGLTGKDVIGAGHLGTPCCDGRPGGRTAAAVLANHRERGRSSPPVRSL